MPTSRISEIIDRNHSSILEEWIRLQTQAAAGGRGLSANNRDFSRNLLSALREALLQGSDDINSSAWSRSREILADFSRQAAEAGLSPSETATYVFSLKEPLFTRLHAEYQQDVNGLMNDVWTATKLVDKLGLFTTETYQKSRELVISRQQQEMMELSTPVVELWSGILALPLIGTLDSSRTQVVMQNLLEAIVKNTAEIAIIDITGVPTVDTLVAQHLLKTVAAARLMGADCIISGIRPQIAQTIIHLGVELENVITKATLSDAFQLALRRTGMTVGRAVKA